MNPNPNQYDDRWIDISVPLRPGLPQWPGDPRLAVRKIADIDNGDPCNATYLEMCAHTGTHVDAPRHFLPQGDTVDIIPLEALTGPARVLDLRNARQRITPRHLEPFDPSPGQRLLLRTPNADRHWSTKPFMNDFTHLSHEAADFLVARKIRTIGIDYLSVGAMDHDGTQTHITLLKAGICIIEGLDLSNIQPGDYDLVCLPLRIADADGAPARALLRPIKTHNTSQT